MQLRQVEVLLKSAVALTRTKLRWVKIVRGAPQVSSRSHLDQAQVCQTGRGAPQVSSHSHSNETQVCQDSSRCSSSQQSLSLEQNSGMSRQFEVLLKSAVALTRTKLRCVKTVRGAPQVSSRSHLDQALVGQD